MARGAPAVRVYEFLCTCDLQVVLGRERVLCRFASARRGVWLGVSVGTWVRVRDGCVSIRGAARRCVCVLC